METYGEWTKKEGLVQVDPIKGGVKTIAFEDAKVDYRKARDANTWVYARQTVVKYPDFYAADDGLKNERRLTDANPQQKEIAWTPGAQLINYECENGGGKHQAVLYLPAGYEKGKTYPMLTYIYEKLSQEYNVYTEPNATRYSNPSVYTSRGYAFLKPDIVYHVNDPGRSAVWCVVPAVKAAIATGMIDTARVGLQGHSWGGYQTTFITTQTNIFKTAVAARPSPTWCRCSARSTGTAAAPTRRSSSRARAASPVARTTCPMRTCATRRRTSRRISTSRS
jgi:dipeptidyl aminopeptidase/acylaminoacyl peptidase